MRHLKIPLLLLALVGLIALSGCGDDESSDSTSTSAESTATDASTESTATDAGSDDYGGQLTTILTTFGTDFQALAPEISGAKTPEDFNTLVDEAETGIQTTIDDLSALEPPAEAQEGQDQLIAAFEGFSSSLTGVSDAAASGDKAALQSAAADLQTAAQTFTTDLTEAAQSLQAAGVSVGSAAGA